MLCFALLCFALPAAAFLSPSQLTDPLDATLALYVQGLELQPLTHPQTGACNTAGAMLCGAARPYPCVVDCLWRTVGRISPLDSES
jgi:hypothetical protein